MRRVIPVPLALALVCASLTACYGDAATSPSGAGSIAPTYGEEVGSPDSPAAKWIESQIIAQDGLLWVYLDDAGGLNHFTQKSFMGDNYKNVPKMDESAEGRSGSSGIMAELDASKHSWGGYMFLNGVLKAGSSEPTANNDHASDGMNLTGAEKLTFYAKGETGSENVEFFVGGFGWERGRSAGKGADSTDKITLGAVGLTGDWQRFEIPLRGVDLSKIACGFGWVASGVDNPGLNKIRFSVDDVRYEFSERARKPMFLQSYASAKPGTDDAVINNFAYVYDNAIAALALTYAGEHVRARQLADAIVYAYENDRYYSDGRLRNAYSNGEPASFPGWKSARGKAFARIPGFYDAKDQKWYEDFYAVSTATGNLAWAILALDAVGKHSSDAQKYFHAAKGIGDFILTLKSETGGFTGGYEGWEPNPEKVTYKSTEHNIDLISAFARLAELTGQQKYADAAAHAKDFVLSMYDAEKGFFYTGTLADGVTANKEVLPLDSNTWAILALGDELKDGEKALNFIEQNMAVGGGYDFNTDKDGVWFEGTAQVALAYRQVGNEAKYRQILDFLNGHAQEDGSITAADRDSVTTGFTVSGTDIPWNYGKRTHVGATAWLAFAQLGVNPLA